MVENSRPSDWHRLMTSLRDVGAISEGYGSDRALVQAAGWPLKMGDTFYLDRAFCQLVEHAAESIPLDTVFNLEWLQSLNGFAYLDKPFMGKVSECRAVGWSTQVGGRVQFFGYREAGLSFSPISAMSIKGESLACIAEVEKNLTPAKIVPSPVVRWIFAAFHLMAQRLSLTIKQKIDRSVRRRAEKAGEKAPEVVKIITLRRMEEARKREAPHDIEWHWQWEVRGHWRNQFYPSENAHKPVFVEAYIKGPTDKPFKSPGLKLFAAVR